MQQELRVFREVRHHGANLHPALLSTRLANLQASKLQRFSAFGLLPLMVYKAADRSLRWKR
jgi:hypothetical protein